MVHVVTKEEAGIRLDKLLAAAFETLSRSQAQKLIEAEQVLVNDLPAESNKQQLAEGDVLEVFLPEPEELSVEPVNLPIEIVYEDDSILIVNKPKGMVVHPAPGHTNDTLVNALLYHCSSLSGINGTKRPGIVHRIDRDTTGLLVICKNDQAHREIAAQLEVHSITRRYTAIAVGRVKEDMTIDAPIGRHQTDRKKMCIRPKDGRRAVTHVRVLEELAGGRYTLIECRLETGRTHQIRVHMASKGHPLLGDTVYGSSKQPFETEGQVLHAGVLGLVHPATGQYMEFQSELPEYFQTLLEKLRRMTS